MTLIFAIVVIWVSSHASAQTPGVIYYGEAGTESANLAYQQVLETRSLQFDGISQSLPSPPTHGVVRQLRPRYLEMSVGLSNFDTDADPDGWRANLILRDHEDRPVVMRANASFELVPRISRIDAKRAVPTSVHPVRWSMPLEFGSDGVARVKLPLRQALKPMLGWSPSFPEKSNRSFVSRSRSRNQSPFVTATPSDLRDLVAKPEFGELRVRVSVPTQGVFHAKSLVRLRPSGLVDTKWPYR